MSKQNGLNISAPVCSLAEIKQVAEAGATEVYFGFMPDRWVMLYGDNDFISRRQSRQAHFAHYNDFNEIVKTAKECGVEATLVMNARYSEVQLPLVYEIIDEWEKRGGKSLTLCDLEVLLHLQRKNSSLRRCLSVMGSVFNHYTVEFYRSLGVSKIVLPRELINLHLIAKSPDDIEFEMIGFYQKCPFYDSFCQFEHAVDYRRYLVTDAPDDIEDTLYTHDPEYEGHGCHVFFKNEACSHHCCACTLKYIRGVKSIKIAGRGFPVSEISQAAHFIKEVYSKRYTLKEDEIRELYFKTFKRGCNRNCYYPGYLHENNSSYSGTVNISRPNATSIRIGHETCEKFLPSITELQYVRRKCSEHNKRTLVTPALSEEMIEEMEIFLVSLSSHEIDIVTADWGLLSILKRLYKGNYGTSRFIAGQQTDFRLFRRRDRKSKTIEYNGRYFYLERSEPTPELQEHLASISLLKPLTRNLLYNMGVRRIELSHIPVKPHLPGDPRFTYSIPSSYTPLAIISPTYMRELLRTQQTCPDLFPDCPIYRFDNALYYRCDELKDY